MYIAWHLRAISAAKYQKTYNSAISTTGARCSLPASAVTSFFRKNMKASQRRQSVLLGILFKKRLCAITLSSSTQYAVSYLGSTVRVDGAIVMAADYYRYKTLLTISNFIVVGIYKLDIRAAQTTAVLLLLFKIIRRYLIVFSVKVVNLFFKHYTNAGIFL